GLLGAYPGKRSRGARAPEKPYVPGWGRRASAKIGNGAARCRAGIAAAWWCWWRISLLAGAGEDWSGRPRPEAGPSVASESVEKPGAGVLTLTGRALCYEHAGQLFVSDRDPSGQPAVAGKPSRREVAWLWRNRRRSRTRSTSGSGNGRPRSTW